MIEHMIGPQRFVIAGEQNANSGQKYPRYDAQNGVNFHEPTARTGGHIDGVGKFDSRLAGLKGVQLVRYYLARSAAFNVNVVGLRQVGHIATIARFGARKFTINIAVQLIERYELVLQIVRLQFVQLSLVFAFIVVINRQLIRFRIASANDYIIIALSLILILILVQTFFLNSKSIGQKDWIITKYVSCESTTLIHA